MTGEPRPSGTTVLPSLLFERSVGVRSAHTRSCVSACAKTFCLSHRNGGRAVPCALRVHLTVLLSPTCEASAGTEMAHCDAVKPIHLWGPVSVYFKMSFPHDRRGIFLY